MSIVKFNIEISNKLILIMGILIIEIGNMTSSIYEKHNAKYKFDIIFNSI